MRTSLSRIVMAAGAVVVVAAVTWLATGVGGQSATAYRAPRTADGRPDLSGIWQAVNTANWDLEAHSPAAAPREEVVGAYLVQPGGLSVVEGGTIPYKPEARRKKEENFRTRLVADALKPEIGDPEAKCFKPGLPRATYMPQPFQIVQSPGKILFAYEFQGKPRVVRMGEAEPWPDGAYDAWMGDSIGRWEGETLVVDVKQLNGRAWLDRAGNYTTEQTHVVERYTAMSPYHLTYEATIEDPTLYTRPWKITMPLYRRMEANAQIIELDCIPLTESFRYWQYYTPETKEYIAKSSAP